MISCDFPGFVDGDGGSHELKHEEFVIDSSSMVSRDIDSDSESDCELPAFDIPAFHKYESKNDIGGFSSTKNNGLYVNVYPDVDSNRDRIAHQKETLKCSIKESEKKMIVKPGFETLEKVPTFLSRRQSKKLGMKEKEKTKGFDWFNMPAPEMTEELKNDLTVVQMRKALDPKHFYKRSALKPDSNPKYFQVGTYEESPLDFYSSRVPKKQRKRTLVEELMADAEFRSYQKKKMSEVLRSQPPKKFFNPKKSKKSKANSSSVKQKKK